MVRQGVTPPGAVEDDPWASTEELERHRDRKRALKQIREAIAPVGGLIEEYARRSEDGAMAMFLRDTHRAFLADVDQAEDYEEMES